MSTHPYSCTLAAVLLWGGLVCASAAAPSVGANGGYQSADGLVVYLGVVPAAMVEGRHEAHPGEEEMHGGVPRGRHAFHVMVAVFDADTGEQVRDARVEARVAPLGLGEVRQPLEPMTIGDTVTYGNYFTLRHGTYRIRVDVVRPRDGAPATVEFTYEHPNG
ncbi:hypothetical protein HUS23_10225 [Ectothiorhodospiraceae bacterium 2226]|nr:hypothetical protein HUS23_10225 [Ectothiorhodospiraceae bacterium 2226]